MPATRLRRRSPRVAYHGVPLRLTVVASAC